MVLTGAHYIYIIFMLVILILMLKKKDIIIPCVLGVFSLAYFYTGSVVGSISAIFNSFIVALAELGPIILVIAVMVSLSKCLEDNDAIQYMVKPFSKVIKNYTSAFFVTGIAIMLISWFFWPTASVALVGAIFLPVAVNAGLPAIGVAMALNLFAHGIALSTDFIIQGAPQITSSSAGIPVQDVITEGMILFWVMSIVTISVAFYQLRRDMKKGMFDQELKKVQKTQNIEFGIKAKISTALVLISFGLNIFLMYKFDLKGGDASALLGGTGVLLMIGITMMNDKKKCLDKVCSHVTEGFLFGIKIFAIIIPIAGFFYMGEVAPITSVLGEVLPSGSQGLLSDIGIALSEAMPFNKVAAASIEMIVGAITGLDGSGFSGMSLAGSTAAVFGSAIDANIGALAALGQISAIWVGGGCLVPWALVSAAAICGVSPIELAKRNFVPVITGLVVTTIVAMFII